MNVCTCAIKKANRSSAEANKGACVSLVERSKNVLILMDKTAI